jgi:hypothetical protein
VKPWRLVSLVLPALACRPVTAGPSSTKPARASERRVPPPIAAPEHSAAASAGSVVRFEPRPGPVLKAEGALAIAFRRPQADELIEAESLAGFGVEVRADVERLGPAAGIEVSLDGGRPRRLAGAALALSVLSPPDRDLEHGEHFLIAAAVDADGRLIRVGNAPISSSVRFWFARRGEGGSGPQVVCWGPRGTYYGGAAEPALDLLLRAADGRGLEHQPITARLEGPGAPAAAQVDAARPWGILGLASGDYRLVVDLSPPAPRATSPCLFTLNRETERPSP